jgi:hypothetical protein
MIRTQHTTFKVKIFYIIYKSDLKSVKINLYNFILCLNKTETERIAGSTLTIKSYSSAPYLSLSGYRGREVWRRGHGNGGFKDLGHGHGWKRGATLKWVTREWENGSGKLRPTSISIQNAHWLTLLHHPSFKNS